jgi:hypothetical protein
VIWSDLDMTCFSDSDNEHFDINDTESKSYFKVENLGNQHTGKLEFKSVVQVDSGCDEGSGCGYRLSEIRRGWDEVLGGASDNPPVASVTLTGEASLPAGTSAMDASEDSGMSVGGHPKSPTLNGCSHIAGEADDSGFNGAVASSHF